MDPLLPAGFPLTGLSRPLQVWDGLADGVVHADSECRSLSHWAHSGGAAASVTASVGSVLSRPLDRVCGCVLSSLQPSEVLVLEASQAPAALLPALDQLSGDAWLALARVWASVDELLELFSDLDSATSAWLHAERLALLGRVEVVRASMLASSPWEDRVAVLATRSSAPRDFRDRLVVSEPGEHAASALRRFRVTSGDDYRSREFRIGSSLTLWGDVASEDGFASARLALLSHVELEAPAKGVAASGVTAAHALLASRLLESAALRSTRDALRLPDHVLVAHNWRSDVRSDTPLAPVLAEAVCRGELSHLGGGALGLRLPAVLGHMLYEANSNSRSGSYDAEVHGTLSSFTGSGVPEDLSRWTEVLEVALTLWADAGGSPRSPQSDRGYARSESPPAYEAWDRARAALLVPAGT